MIIDFHANYNHNSFKNSFRYLTRDEDNYDHPIWECGVQLVDMVYLKMNL